MLSLGQSSITIFDGLNFLPLIAIPYKMRSNFKIEILGTCI